MTHAGHEALAQRFPLVVPVQVRFRDLDALGHVNNAVYLSYLELARVVYFRERLGITGPQDLGFILARAEIDYRSPVHLHEALYVGIGVAEIRRRSFVFAYEIREAETARLVAEARTVQVMYDYRNNRPVPIPDDLRQRLEADRIPQQGEDEP